MINPQHLHDANRQGDLEVIETVVDPIRNGPVSEDRGKTTTAGFEKRVGAANVEKALMLSGKAGIRQVFRGGRTAYRDGNLPAILLFELLISLKDGRAKRLTRRRLIDDRARLGAALFETRDIGLIELVQ